MCIISYLHTEYSHSPKVLWRTTYLTVNNATVVLEWEQETGVSYNVSVVPYPLESRLSGNTSQLIVLYNISYRVIVVATLCGQNMNMTAIDIIVNYPGELYSTCNIIGCLSLSLSLAGVCMYLAQCREILSIR